MSYAERNTWAQVISTILVLAIYVPWTLASLPATDGGDWLWRMAWVIGGGITVSIVLAIVWGIIAGIRKEDSGMDERDRRITHAGERVGQAFMVIGGLTAIVLCAAAAEPFWIAQVIFAGFALSALVGGIATIIMYRVGMP